MKAQPVRVGIVGGGLMGRELAAAIGRWVTLEDHPAVPELVAVADLEPAALAWFDRVASVRTLTPDYRVLLDDPAIDVVYVALPHHLHEKVMCDVVAAGKDMLAEKPFGIDLAAAETIAAAARDVGAFVRVSSEMPFFSGAQVAIKYIRSGAAGRIIEATSSLRHSSDLNPDKPINWKRQSAYCGEIGVMGDLGMHVTHVPSRLGWQPRRVYAVLQDIVRERRDGDRMVPCDTIDNATLHTWAGDGPDAFPLTFQTSRIAPGESNTWKLRLVGMTGGVEFSTRNPKAVRLFSVDGGQQTWRTVEVGSQSVFATTTGAIFEFGFSDAILQMWAAFLAERCGSLGDRFACATPEEAVAAHRLFAAAMESHHTGHAIDVPQAPPATMAVPLTDQGGAST
jgi:predicted dehydrogenase